MLHNRYFFYGVTLSSDFFILNHQQKNNINTYHILKDAPVTKFISVVKLK